MFEYLYNNWKWHGVSVQLPISKNLVYNWNPSQGIQCVSTRFCGNTTDQTQSNFVRKLLIFWFKKLHTCKCDFDMKENSMNVTDMYSFTKTRFAEFWVTLPVFSVLRLLFWLLCRDLKEGKATTWGPRCAVYPSSFPFLHHLAKIDKQLSKLGTSVVLKFLLPWKWSKTTWTPKQPKRYFLYCRES